jgi:quercetin dioxygenase-like cupin family protein
MMPTELSASDPYVLAAGAGKPMSWFSSSITLKASNREIGAAEVIIGPGDEPPLHVHNNEDEWFYVLDGEVTFHVGGENHSGTVGAFVSFPRGIPHTFTIESPTARFLLMNTPGGFERMFELAPKTVEDAVRALNAYGVEVVGPHPRHAGSR